MIKKYPILTKHIGFRVKECVFAEVERLADSEGKPVNDWCRDRLLDALRGSAANPVEHALLAEIAATQGIPVSLFFPFPRDAKRPSKRSGRSWTGPRKRNMPRPPTYFGKPR